MRNLTLASYFNSYCMLVRILVNLVINNSRIEYNTIQRNSIFTMYHLSVKRELETKNYPKNSSKNINLYFCRGIDFTCVDESAYRRNDLQAKRPTFQRLDLVTSYSELPPGAPPITVSIQVVVWRIVTQW